MASTATRVWISTSISFLYKSKTATALADQGQQNALKFGFSAKGTASKVCPTGIMVLNCILPSTTMESEMLTTRLPHFVHDVLFKLKSQQKEVNNL